MGRTETLFAFDAQYPGLAAGVDEAGRGPLAGPVAAAACIMPRDAFIDGIDDSKRLSAAARERLYARITGTALAFAVEVVDAAVIDEINILNATKLAMRRAVEASYSRKRLRSAEETESLSNSKWYQRPFSIS